MFKASTRNTEHFSRLHRKFPTIPCFQHHTGVAQQYCSKGAKSDGSRGRSQNGIMHRGCHHERLHRARKSPEARTQLGTAAGYELMCQCTSDKWTGLECQRPGDTSDDRRAWSQPWKQPRGPLESSKPRYEWPSLVTVAPTPAVASAWEGSEIWGLYVLHENNLM